MADRNDSHNEVGEQQIEQIEAMERVLDELVAANEALEEALQRYEQAQECANQINYFLGSDEWFAAREADEAGLLPADLKRGILSEDAAFDALVLNHDAAILMLEIATEALR